MTEALLTVENLHSELVSARGTVRVVDDVSLRLSRGRALGLVGESGSGKTILARSIMGLAPPGVRLHATGRVRLGDTDLLGLSPRAMRDVWGRRLAIVLQDPLRALNPVMRVGAQLGEALARGRPARGREAARRVEALLTEVGLPDARRCARAFPHELSGGMRQRVTIAMALAGGPELLIADEPTTALDVTVQAQILALLRAEQAQRTMGLILITHDLAVVAGHTDEIAVMYAGQVVEHGPSRAVVHAPAMPYTRALLQASPTLDGATPRPVPIAGSQPVAGAAPQGCRFHPRCPRAQARCRAEMPPLEQAGDRAVRCWYPLTGAAERTPTAASGGVAR